MLATFAAIETDVRRERQTESIAKAVRAGDRSASEVALTIEHPDRRR